MKTLLPTLFLLLFSGFTLGQSCATVNAPNGRVSAAGGIVYVDIVAPDTCKWTNSNSDGLEPKSGNGPGRVQITIGQNAGWFTTHFYTVAGTSVQIEQDEGCTFKLIPSEINFPRAGGQITVGVGVSHSTCHWWTQNGTYTNGIGSGQISITVPPNTGQAQTNTLIIGATRPEAFQKLNLKQENACGNYNSIIFNRLKLCANGRNISF